MGALGRAGFLLFFLLAAPLPSLAERVLVKDGNIYYEENGRAAVQMTISGLDSDPRLSPDKKTILFVRDTPTIRVETGGGDASATELWLVNVATKQAELMLRGKDAEKVEDLLADFSAPSFSPDGRFVYFSGAAWATSGAVHKISLATKAVSFLIDGTVVGVILKGKRKGALLVERALIKYDKRGESLGRDVYLWLVSSDGKPIEEIGPADSAAARAFKKKTLG